MNDNTEPVLVGLLRDVEANTQNTIVVILSL